MLTGFAKKLDGSRFHLVICVTKKADLQRARRLANFGCAHPEGFTQSHATDETRRKVQNCP